MTDKEGKKGGEDEEEASEREREREKGREGRSEGKKLRMHALAEGKREIRGRPAFPHQQQHQKGGEKEQKTRERERKKEEPAEEKTREKRRMLLLRVCFCLGCVADIGLAVRRYVSLFLFSNLFFSFSSILLFSVFFLLFRSREQRRLDASPSLLQRLFLVKFLAQTRRKRRSRRDRER